LGSSSVGSSFFSSSVGLRFDLEFSFFRPLVGRVAGALVLVIVDKRRISLAYYLRTGDIEVDVSWAGMVTS
jgi:hypothetical protein